MPEPSLTIDQAAAYTAQAEILVGQAIATLGSAKVNSLGVYVDASARVRDLRAARETITAALGLIEGARWPDDTDYNSR